MAALWLLMMLCFCWIKKTTTAKLTVNGITFHEMSTYTRDVYEYAAYIERDKYNPDYLLFADRCALKSIDMKFKRVQVLAGDIRNCSYKEDVGTAARFNSITGFEQLNRTHIIIADFPHHCLRLFDRFSNATSTYIGKCQESGQDNGFFHEARLTWPDKLARKTNTSIIYLCESGGIRKIDIAEKTVESFVNLAYAPAAIILDESEENLYISAYFRIVVINIETKQFTPLSQSTDSGSNDGPLNAATFAHIRDLRFVNKDTLMAFDATNFKVRIIDLANSTVSSICDGTEGSLDGDISTCQILAPHSGVVLKDQSTILISANREIRSLSTSGFIQASTTTSLPSDRFLSTFSSLTPGFTVTPTTTKIMNPEWLLPVSVLSALLILVIMVGIAVFCKMKIYKGKCCERKNDAGSSSPNQEIHQLPVPHHANNVVQEEQPVYDYIRESDYNEIEGYELSLQDMKLPNPPTSPRPLKPGDKIRPALIVPSRQVTLNADNAYSYAMVHTRKETVPQMSETGVVTSGYNDFRYVDMVPMDKNYASEIDNQPQTLEKKNGEYLDVQAVQANANGETETIYSPKEAFNSVTKPGYVGTVEIANYSNA